MPPPLSSHRVFIPYPYGVHGFDTIPKTRPQNFTKMGRLISTFWHGIHQMSITLCLSLGISPSQADELLTRHKSRRCQPHEFNLSPYQVPHTWKILLGIPWPSCVDAADVSALALKCIHWMDTPSTSCQPRLHRHRPYTCVLLTKCGFC